MIFIATFTHAGEHMICLSLLAPYKSCYVNTMKQFSRCYAVTPFVAKEIIAGSILKLELHEI
jgi:hypothetical protein